MSGLRLGALEDDRPTRITIELRAELARLLEEYARVHAELNGLEAPHPAAKLVPAMVERFIAADREFARRRRKP